VAFNAVAIHAFECVRTGGGSAPAGAISWRIRLANVHPVDEIDHQHPP
jgi:hypothetical protein